MTSDARTVLDDKQRSLAGLLVDALVRAERAKSLDKASPSMLKELDGIVSTTTRLLTNLGVKVEVVTIPANKEPS